ncbi:MAG: hypothetical protein ACOY9Y_10770 [Bacillota bacterium]
MPKQTVCVDVRRVTCPQCNQHFFEFHDQEIFLCPHCGAGLHDLPDSQCEDKEVTVYLDPLSGQVSAEVA